MKALGLFGDFYHRAEAQRDLFLAEGGEGVTWTVGTPTTVDWSRLGDYHLVVLASENRIDPEGSTSGWMTDALAQALQDWVRAGGGLVAFHSGLASYPEEGPYVALVGGSFLFHPRPHPRYQVVLEPGDHPLTRGVDPFEVEDELYFVHRDPQTTLLASVTHPEYGSSAAFWCAQRDRGRIVGLTPGHNPETLDNPRLRTLVRRSLEWCCPRSGSDFC